MDKKALNQTQSEKDVENTLHKPKNEQNFNSIHEQGNSPETKQNQTIAYSPWWWCSFEYQNSALPTRNEQLYVLALATGMQSSRTTARIREASRAATCKFQAENWTRDRP